MLLKDVMDEFKLRYEKWSKLTDQIYSICEKHDIAFNTNISDCRMWVRPKDNGDIVYKEIKSVSSCYEKENLVEVREPHHIFEDSGEIVIDIFRK